jgi:hypothetical protein
LTWKLPTIFHPNIKTNKPVGDRDHEVLGMGSFGEYKLYGMVGVFVPYVCTDVGSNKI